MFVYDEFIVRQCCEWSLNCEIILCYSEIYTDVVLSFLSWKSSTYPSVTAVPPPHHHHWWYSIVLSIVSSLPPPTSPAPVICLPSCLVVWLAGCLFVNINRLADYHEMANIPHQYSACILKTKAITSYILPAAIVCCFYSSPPMLCPQSCYLSLAETQKPTYLFTHVHFCFNFSIFFCQTIVFLASPFPRRGIKTKLAAAQSPRLWVWQATVFAPRPWTAAWVLQPGSEEA